MYSATRPPVNAYSQSSAGQTPPSTPPSRDQDTALHTLLNRLTKHRKHLSHDMRLHMLAQRKPGKRRLRNRRTQHTLTVAPIPIPIKKDPTLRAQDLRQDLTQHNDSKNSPRATTTGSRSSHTDSTSHPKPHMERTGLATKTLFSRHTPQLSMIKHHAIQVETTKKTEIIDVTSHVTKAIEKSRINQGLLCIHTAHTTACIAINENDPSLHRDLLDTLQRTTPPAAHYRHTPNAPAHILTSIIKPGATIPIKDQAPLLGTWQRILLLEFDGPRTRTIHAAIIGEE